MSSSEWIAVGGLMSGAAVFAAGLVQYARAQRWKRLEFVAAEMQNLLAEPRVQLALTMLDWDHREYDLSSVTSRMKDRAVTINNATLTHALLPHTERPDGFSDVEAGIRACFDELFTQLQRLEHFIETGLVLPADLRPYLRYWVAILGTETGGRKDPELLHTLWRYLAVYGYDEVLTLLRRFGYPAASEHVTQSGTTTRGGPGGLLDPRSHEWRLSRGSEIPHTQRDG